MFVFIGCSISRAEGYNYSAFYFTASYVYDFSGSIGVYYKNSDIFGGYANLYMCFDNPVNYSPAIKTPTEYLIANSNKIDHLYSFEGLTIGGTANLNGILSLQAGVVIQNTHNYKVYQDKSLDYIKFTTKDSKINFGIDAGISVMIEYNLMFNVGYNSAVTDKYWAGFGVLLY